MFVGAPTETMTDSRQFCSCDALAFGQPFPAVDAVTRSLDPSSGSRVCHICRTVNVFPERVTSAAVWTHFMITQALRGTFSRCPFLKEKYR